MEYQPLFAFSFKLFYVYAGYVHWVLPFCCATRLTKSKEEFLHEDRTLFKQTVPPLISHSFINQQMSLKHSSDHWRQVDLRDFDKRKEYASR